MSFIAGANSKAQVVQSQDYDPWGWQLQGIGQVATTTNKYKYNGKEEQAEIGLYDYGARFYDNTIGRWGVVDPMAEATYHQSPFGYVGSNPVRNTDPTGMLSDEEYKKWAKEADALSDKAQQQGVGAYSALAQDGPGPKGKKADPPGYPSDVRSASEQNAVLRPKDLGPQYTDVEKASQLGVDIASAVEAPFSIVRLGKWFKSLFTLAKDIKAVESVASTAAQIKVASEYTIQNIAGFYIRGNTSIVQGTYTRNIQALASLEEGTSVFKLIKIFEAEARTAGATRIVLNGLDIVETRLINAQAAQRLGYTFQQTSINSIQLIRTVK